MRLGDILGALRRHVLLVLAITAVVTFLAVYFSAQAPPTYRAAAVVRVTDVRTALTGGLGDPWSERLGGALLSQIYLLKSRGVIADAVQAQGLRLQSRTEDFSIAELKDVQVAEQAPSDSIRLRFAEQGVTASSGGEVVTAAYGAPLEIAGVRFTLTRAPRVESALLVVEPREAMIGRISVGLRAWAREKTDIIDIDYTDTDPGFAQQVVNGVVASFQEMSARAAKQQSQRRRQFIEEQLASTEAELREAQRALSTFRSREQGLSLSAKYSAQQSALMSLEVQREQLAADLRRFQASLAALQRPRGDRSLSQYRTLPSSPGLTANPVVSQLYGQLSTYETEREVMTTGPWANAPTHPDVQRLDALIASTEVKLIEAVRSHIAGVQSQLATLDELRARNSASVQELPDAVIEEAQLVQQVEVAQSRANLLRDEYQRVRISEAVEVGQVEVVDLAGFPAAAESNKPMRTVLIGLILGLALGGGGALLLDSLNTSIRRRDELETVLHVPGLAVIPQIASAAPKRSRIPLLGARMAKHAKVQHHKRNGNGKGHGSSTSSSLVTLSQLQSTQAEAYRTLRTNLIFSQAVQTLRVIAVSSAVGEEGKTTTAANLAIAFAQQGMRVILIGGDLRRPRVEKIFGVPREPGLTDLLLRRVRIKEAIHATAVPGLKLLPCGVLPPNPSELLGGQRMRSLVASLSKRFDIVIIDTPPLLVASDASVLGAMADGVLMVVRAGRTDRGSAQQAMQQLSAVGARVVGAVLNDPDAQVPRYGMYYGDAAAKYYAAIEEDEEQTVASG
ncbi:hypothetical protein BH23GEM7_BH23GEM7_08100 [soil metagenome]